MGADDFRLYPNPAADQLQVVLNGTAQAKLVMHNQIGTVVLQQMISNRLTSLDVQALPAGVYFITVNNGKASGTQKVVIQH
ncbi:hypothetical protein D3C87_1657760 [compost metagenome]